MSSARISGYQIQYSLNKNFKSGNKYEVRQENILQRMVKSEGSKSQIAKV